MSTKVLVLDSSAFIMGYDPLTIKERQFTTPALSEELRVENVAWLRFKTACEIGKLKLLTPSSKTMETVEELARNTGDLERLSEVDKEVLAVAVELKQKRLSPVIVSDDYSIQNLADQLKLEYVSLSTLGIRYRFQWLPYCPACHRKYPPNTSSKTCDVCGTPLKRRPLKKASATRKTKNKS